MNRTTKVAAAVALTAGLAVTGASAADAAAAPQYKLNGTDAAFLRSNEQVNLAEITIGTIALQRANGTAARHLAVRTVADHRRTRVANEAVARKIGIREPAEPNAMQQQVAAFLKQAPRINREYFVAQVAGHEQSIAQTRNEIKNGIRPRVVAYAKYYLPIAQMHLEMAATDLARWTKQHSG